MSRPWLELARVSNLPTVWTNVIAAWLLAGGKSEWQPLAWLLCGGSLIYTGGMFLNDAADAAWDRQHRPERPIPSGRIPAALAWTAGIGFLTAGFAMFVWGAEACIWLTGMLVAAVVVYDLFHKPWAASVLIMGSCRTLLYLAAASAVTGELSWRGNHEVCIKATALGAYIVGLTYAARAESGSSQERGGLEVLWEVIMIGSALTGAGYLLPLSPPGRILGIGLILVFSILIVHQSARLMRTPPGSNIGRAVGRLLAGIVIWDAVAVCSVSPVTAIVLAASFPLLLLWQKKITAT